ncbi:MAG: amino acid adenylation domain-containing protein [Anaerolineae bacterium]|nr:amino acid adenylation domain-containing protein [Anaerolineae bacterium]
MNKRNIYLLTQAVTAGAQRYPEWEAVRFSGQSLTYGELDRRANQLAHTLLAEGVQRGDRVGIYMNKGLESAVAIYGIMKAGAAYVPLDPFAPVGRLSFVIRNCGIRCLISNDFKLDGLAEMAAGTGLEVVVGLSAPGDLPLRTLSWDDIATAPDTAPDVHLTEQDLAYILYTSGSTGDPKGIMHTHRSGLTFAEWGVDTYNLTESDRLSNHAPLHFDLSTFDFFAGALAGAATVIIPEALTKFPVNMTRLIQIERITVWYSVPFALIQLLLNGAIDKHDLSSLRWVLFAGEPFPTKHLRPLMAQLPQARFSNLYGPTETNVCTFYHVPPLPKGSDEPIPIGEPCTNVEALVVDGDDRPVASGETGELLIRSPLVMRGYWGRPDLTEKGFYLRRVFGDHEDIFYRTGDLVEEQEDGNLKYLGRKDRQIKTRGYRVELDEIEVALLSHPGVQEAAVYPVPDGEGSNLIEAAVIARNGAALEVGALLVHAGAQLPSYAVPAKITILAQFPRTSTGKINRRALQAATAAGAAA